MFNAESSKYPSELILHASGLRPTRPPEASSSLTACELQVESLIARLCEVPRQSSVEHAYRIGELITQELFGGDLEQLRARSGRDPVFRRLSAHPNLPVSHAGLWRAIGIYELFQRLPELRHRTQLGVTQLRAVLGLPKNVQVQLLQTAERERWTGQRIEAEAAACRASIDTRSRSNMTLFSRALKRLDQAALDLSLATDADVCQSISPEAARSARERIRAARAELDAFEAALERREPSAAEPPELSEA